MVLAFGGVMEQFKQALLTAMSPGRKVKSQSVRGLVEAYPRLRGILDFYRGVVVVGVENLDFITLREPTQEEKLVLCEGARFVGDNLVIRVNSLGHYSTARTELTDSYDPEKQSTWRKPEDICPVRDTVLTIVITCVVDSFVIMFHEHNT